MSIPTRIADLFRRRPVHESPPANVGALREFVYLDDVSVQSLLVSRLGGLPEQIRESRSSSRATDLGAKADAHVAGISAHHHNNNAQGYEVLSRATIQSAFKTLYEGERGNFVLGTKATGDPSRGGGLQDLAGHVDALKRDHWLIDPSEGRRGDLFEAEVEIDADAIYQMAEVITTLGDIAEPIPKLSADVKTDAIKDIRAVARVLDGLLTGLVPIRGRLVDYSTMRIGDREFLVHRKLLEEIAGDATVQVHPVFVVGVAERELFWRDIRRVVFSGARHTLFGRLTTSGITDRWQPLKAADVISAVVPDFEAVIAELARVAEGAMGGGGPANTWATQHRDASLRGTHQGLHHVAGYSPPKDPEFRCDGCHRSRCRCPSGMAVDR